MGDAGLPARHFVCSLAEAAGLAARLLCRWAVSKRAASLGDTVRGTSSGLGEGEPGDAANFATEGRKTSWRTSNKIRHGHFVSSGSSKTLCSLCESSLQGDMHMPQAPRPGWDCKCRASAHRGK